MEFVSAHLEQLISAEGLLLIFGFGWGIYRETQRGVVIKKLLADIQETANSPIVDILKVAFKPEDD